MPVVSAPLFVPSPIVRNTMDTINDITENNTYLFFIPVLKLLSAISLEKIYSKIRIIHLSFQHIHTFVKIRIFAPCYPKKRNTV